MSPESLGAKLSYDQPDWPDHVRQSVAELANVEGAVMLALKWLMDQFGYISEPALVLVSDLLHLTPPQVFAVATFYHELRLEKPAQTVFMLCRGPACRIDGMVALRKLLERRLGITVGERTSDNRFAIESSGCLGICPHPPAMLIDHELAGRVTPEQIERLIDDRAGSTSS